MKSKYYNNTKFSALSQDGMDEDYFSDVHGSGEENRLAKPLVLGRSWPLLPLCRCTTAFPVRSSVGIPNNKHEET